MVCKLGFSMSGEGRDSVRLPNPGSRSGMVGPARTAGTWEAWWVGPAFAAFATWLFLWPLPADIPLTPAQPVAHTSIETKPLRAVLGDPPRIQIGPYQFNCNECHRLFRSALQRRGPLAQHTHITLNHGLNDRCFNCHDRLDRERLVLRDGRRVGFDAVPTLCSQCHGTTFRDWERGMHGKHLGAWSPTDVTRRRLACTECHDPHHPAYPVFTPLPPPRTLRMGDPPAHHDSAKRSPLAQWRPHEDPKEEAP